MNQTSENAIIFNSFDFYESQIKLTLDIWKDHNSNLFLLRDPIYSFFSGQNLSKENFDTYAPTILSEGHLYNFIIDIKFQNFISLTNSGQELKKTFRNN